MAKRKYLIRRCTNTDDGVIEGRVRWNSYWKTYQVTIDGELVAETKTLTEAKEELDRSGMPISCKNFKKRRM